MTSAMKFPIGIKIYALAAIILVILAGVALSNYQQMQRVHQEILVFADYTAPLKNQIASVNIYALEQEVHLERILRLYEVQPLATEQVAAQTQRFEELGLLVQQELEQAIALAEQATSVAATPTTIAAFARLTPLFQILAEDHQNFQEQALEIVYLLQSGEQDQARFLDIEFEELEVIFNNRLYSILLDLNQMAAATAQRINQHEQNLLSWNLSVVGIAILIGLILATLITWRLVYPIKQLVQGAEAVETGHLETRLAIHSGDEIETLAQSFNVMVQDVQQKQVLKEAFGQYVDPRIVESLIAQQTDMRGRKEVITVSFLDLAKFSTISEMLTPARLVTLINQHLTLATAPIIETQGVVDKFIGDAIVAFWGPPFVDQADHARLACRAALEQLAQLEKLQRRLPEIVGIRKGIPKLGVRIGLDTGELVIGNIGAEHLQSYTVLGRTMEIAETLEGANKRYGTQILLTEQTRQLAGDMIEVREIDCLPLGEQNTLIPVYELLAYGTPLDRAISKLCDSFAEGLHAYRQEDWLRAQASFETCLQIDRNDGPSQFYLKQIAQVSGTSPELSATTMPMTCAADDNMPHESVIRHPVPLRSSTQTDSKEKVTTY